MEKIRNIKIIGKFNLMIIKIIFDIYMYIILVNIYNENIENTNIIFLLLLTAQPNNLTWLIPYPDSS